MKKKFLLLVSLVLLGVQGWSIPLDSLKTHVSTLDSLQRNRFERLDTLKPFDGFIHPGFNPSSIVFDDVNGNTSNKFSFTCLSNLPDTITFTTNVGESESYSFDLTDIAGGGPAPEHQGGSTLLDVLFVVNLNDKTGMYTHEKQMLEDDGPFSSGDYWLWQPTTRHSVIYLPTTSGSHDAKVVVRALLMGVIPIQKKTIYLKGSTINTSTDLERHINTSGPSFPDVIVGDSVTVPLHVSGTNLNGPLSVKLDDKTGMFHIDRDNITADEATNGGVDVMVTYKPTFPGTHGASIDITGDVSENVSVVFTGHSNYPSPPLITVDPTSLDFGDVVKGETRTRPITITGTYLTDSLTLFLDQDYPYVFSIDKTSISIEEAKNGAIVNVTYSPTMLGNNDWGNIEIYIGNAQNPIYWIQGQDPIDVPLSGFADWPPTPSITVDPSTYDFGTVNTETTHTAIFTVTGSNLNDRISIDMDLETNGGEYTFAPTSLPPSGGTVTVTFKPVYNGSSGAAFTLTSGQVSAHFAVTGTCVIPPHISPSTTSLDFGTVDKGREKTKTFNVAGASLTGNLTLTTNSSYYTVSPATITPAEARTNPTVTVTYKPTAGGNHDAILSISGGGADNKTINLSGKCVAIDVTPSTYDFGTINQGEEKTKEFTIIGTNLTAPISIDMDLETNGGEYTFSPTSLPPSGGTVTVKYKPIYNGSSGVAFTLTSGQASAHFAVTGTCVKPNISVNPTSLAFGNVVKGNNPTKTFKVTGTDLTGNLSVSSSNSTYFTVSPTTITAAQAKAGAIVTVTYKASAEGSHSGTITISGGGASPKTVNVSGKCVVPAISVSPTSIAFGTVAKGQSVDKTFGLHGGYLTGSLTLSSNNPNFIVYPTSISAAEAIEGKTVTVTYKPTAAGSHSGTITIKGGGATSKSVSVSGKCAEITTSTSSLTFTQTSSGSMTFKVTGINLTSNLTLTSSSSYFTVSPRTITPSDAEDGKTVKVSCNVPSNIQHTTATITISGGSANSKTVSVVYVNVPPVQINSIEPDGGNEAGNDEFTNGGSLDEMNGFTTDIDELEMNSKVYADRLNIIIESPVEQKAVISDIAGHIRGVNLQAGRNEFPVDASGIYIVRIREKTTKLMLK